MHRDHYFSYTPVPESTHLDCYYPESLPSFWNTPRSRLFPHPRLKIRAPTKTDMNSPLLRHLTLKISINRGHRRKIGTAKLWRRKSLHCARTLHEISTKRNLIRKSLQFPTPASRNRITTFSSVNVDGVGREVTQLDTIVVVQLSSRLDSRVLVRGQE